MTAARATASRFGRQLAGSVLALAGLITVASVAWQLYLLHPQDDARLLALMPQLLLGEALRAFLPAVLLLLLINRQVLVPLGRLLHLHRDEPAAAPMPAAHAEPGGAAGLPETLAGIGERLASTRLALECSRDWCERLFDDAQQALLVLDPGGETLLDANPAAARLLVRNREDLQGLALAELCPDSLLALRALLSRVQQDRSGWSGDLCWRNALGDALPLAIKAAAIAQPRGEVILATLQDRREGDAVQQRIARLAYHDALTGLPNRVLLRDRLEMMLAHRQRSGARGALLVIDTDNFKTVNDSLGHQAGDRLLRELAGRMVGVLREGDTVARLGGDEFAVLPQQLEGDSAVVLEQAMTVVERLRAGLEQPFDLEGHQVHVTISVGVAVYPDDGGTVDELLRRADSAMYQAKSSGRDATHFFSPELEERVARRLTMGTALRHALSNEEFVLQFQPQLRLKDGAVVGCEALVRWDRPGHGRLAPLEFLPDMEEMGLLGELGFWVLDRACAYWRDAHQRGLLGAGFRIAVNVSADQFNSATFAQRVRSVLEENRMPGGALELEITEQALVLSLEGAADKITALQALGVSFAIDDFGTGYSSLAYLQRLPVDCLKIDRSFMQRISQGHGGANLVDLIIAIGRKLQLRVVAEGIETQAQADYVAAHGGDMGQGFLFGRPMDWPALLELMATGTGAAGE